MDEMKENRQDKEIQENKEGLSKHEESNDVSFSDVLKRIDGLEKRLNDFEGWVNEAIGGIDKTQSDEAEDTYEETGDESEEEVATIDKDWYERQARYLEGGR